MKKKAFEVIEDELFEPTGIVVDEDSIESDAIIVEDGEGVEIEKNIQVGAWASASDFVKYCVRASRAAPEIKASNLNSLRRAIAYYEGLETEIAEGAAADADHAELSIEQLEILDKVEDLAETVREQLSVAAQRVGIAKTASKATGFVYVVDPFLFSIARICINAKISNGKNIEDVFQKLASRFDINERETLAVRQIMRDMGYPIHGSFVADDGAYDMIRQYFG
jgi:Arc/MetJ-type ribon-helix-helix transcriptional regulator